MPNLSVQHISGKVITTDRKLVVLHTPKCGGTSLFRSLRKAFGISAVYADYRHEVRQSAANTPDNCSVIYGHFRAIKYQHLYNAVWITMLREPVDRILSLYFNYLFYPVERLKNEPTELRLRVNQGKIGLLEFARYPAIAGQMHKYYFGGFEMNRFDLIILHSSYAAGVHRLSKLIGVPLSVEHRNVSSSRSHLYTEARLQIENDSETLHDLKAVLRDEIEFFERAAALPTAVH
jgi:hypothetical protein